MIVIDTVYVIFVCLLKLILTETKNVSVLFYKNLKSSSLHDSHIWFWGFFTFLVALAHGAAVHHGVCELARLIENWTPIQEENVTNMLSEIRWQWDLLNIRNDRRCQPQWGKIFSEFEFTVEVEVEFNLLSSHRQ